MSSTIANVAIIHNSFDFGAVLNGDSLTITADGQYAGTAQWDADDAYISGGPCLWQTADGSDASEGIYEALAEALVEATR